MGGGAVPVHDGERQDTDAAAVSAPPAYPPSWALGTMTAVKGTLDAIRVDEAVNPLPKAQKWVLDKQEAFAFWLSRQPIAVEAVICAGLAALQGAAAGALVSTFNKDLASSFEASAAQRAAMGLDPKAVKNPFLSPEGIVANPVVQARNFAVLTGTNAGISCILKRVRGVDDIENSVAAAFGSGFLFQLVSSAGPPNIIGAVGTGAFFALIQGGCFKLGQMISKEKETTTKSPRPRKEDVYYAKARSMLMKLGLERYEHNFRKGMLMDHILPLLNESALKDVRIPPGPRLVILDHIQRDPELMKGMQSS